MLRTPLVLATTLLAAYVSAGQRFAADFRQGATVTSGGGLIEIRCGATGAPHAASSAHPSRTTA